MADPARGRQPLGERRGAEEPFVPPVRLRDYRIEGELGRGGMGQVFGARDLRLDRPVAIKMLPPVLARDPEGLSRLLREARILAALNHPHIAAIHGLEEAEGGTRVLVLERVEGESLAERLSHGPLALVEALDVARQIALGLEAAHERGIIHRDLKPANVMVTPDGVVKILDFGIAHRVPGTEGSDSESETVSFAAPTGIVGTPAYMSPEQVRGQPQDKRADIFSFGCVLYECLSGRRAFAGATIEETLEHVLRHEPDWSALPAQVPQGLRELLARCVRKQPRERLRDIGDARLEIEEELGAERSPAAEAPGKEAHHNLPEERTSFVGRERELGECEALLQKTRMLTLTGSGGCGKTRLALRLAESVLGDFPDGVRFIDLAPLVDPARVAPALATALGAHEEHGKETSEILGHRIGGRRILIVLDNCEHVLGACADLADSLLERCPRLCLLATSRESLRISGEQIYRVPSLSLPDPVERRQPGVVSRSEAVRLFLERAIFIEPEFRMTESNTPAVAEICRRLDGIPLALELAAARTKVLGVDEIRNRLDDRFRLLSGSGRGLLPRHQTLRATIAWSYDLLDKEERRLLRGLSVFASTWTLDAATAVCGDGRDEFEILDVTDRLIDKSLVGVQREEGSQSRYRLLETVRQFALEKLSDERETQDRRTLHLDYYLALAEEGEPKLWGGPEQVRWLLRFEREHENLLLALEWCESAPGGADKALRLVAALWRFWYVHDHFRLGRQSLARALDRTAEFSPARARALYGAGVLTTEQGDYPEARRHFEESLRAYRRIGDPQWEGRALTGLGIVHTSLGEYEAARAYYEESLAIYEETGDMRGKANALHNLGFVAMGQCDYRAALSLSERSLALARQVGEKHHITLTVTNIGVAATKLGELVQARERFRESLQLARELVARRAGAAAIEGAGELASALGRCRGSVRFYGAATALREEIGAPLDPKDAKEEGALVSDLRCRLGEITFESEWAAGRGLSFEAAVGEALAWLESNDWMAAETNA